MGHPIGSSPSSPRNLPVAGATQGPVGAAVGFVPVSLDVWTRAKECFHRVCRTDTVNKVAAWYGNPKAQQITAMRSRFAEPSARLDAAQRAVAIVGGDTPESGAFLVEAVLQRVQTRHVTSMRIDSGDCLAVLREAAADGRKACVLVMANRWQHGGVGECPYGGSQEERIVRHSNLIYLVHPRFNPYYRARRQVSGMKPGEHYIPYYGAICVPELRVAVDGQEFEASAVSMADLDMRPGHDEQQIFAGMSPDARQQAIVDTRRLKIRAMLAAAAMQNPDVLVLGALGCGAFGNAVDQTAKLFADELGPGGPFQGVFRDVRFAIHDSNPGVAETFAQSITAQHNSGPTF